MLKASSFSIIFSQIINVIFPIITIPVLINKIGIEDYGKYNYINLITTLLCSIIDYNFFTTGIIYIQKNKNLVTTFVRILISLLVSIIFILCYRFLDNDLKNNIFYIVIYLIAWGLNSAYALTALEMGNKIFLGNTISKLIFLAGVYFFVTNYHDAFGILCFSSFIFSILTTYFYFKNISKPSLPLVTEIISYFKYDLWSVGVQIGGFLTGNLHLFIGKYFLNAVDYGLVSLFDRIFRSVVSVFSSFSNSLMTRFYSLRESNRKREIYTFSLIISLIYSFSIFLLPPLFSFFNLKFDNYQISYNTIFFIFSFWGLLAINAALLGINVLQISGKSNFYSLIYLVSFFAELIGTYCIQKNYNINSTGLMMLLNESIIFLMILIGARRYI